MATADVHVDGLDEFRRAVDAAADALPAAVRLAFIDAAEIVADDARPRVPRRSGRARGSVRVEVGPDGATVVGGGPRAPYFGWLDFGGAAGIRGSVRRPYLKQGRYIYREAAQNAGRYPEVMSDALVGAVERAGLDVT